MNWQLPIWKSGACSGEWYRDGRYDVALEPKDKTKNAVIIEFKVFNSRKEKTLEDTVRTALEQIEEKKYETALTARGIPKEQIYKYGFAFEGKNVLIG